MLILVGGLPGSGKSYFALHLSEKLGAKYLSSDKLRREMGALGKYSEGDKLSVYDTMLSICRDYIKNGETVVLDATFYLQKLRQMFLDLTTEFSSPFYFMLIETEEDIVRKRLSQKRRNSEADLSVYLKINKEFEKLSLPYLKIESTENNIEEMLDKALQYIRKGNGTS